jgi:hypothetical protein
MTRQEKKKGEEETTRELEKRDEVEMNGEER